MVLVQLEAEMLPIPRKTGARRPGFGAKKHDENGSSKKMETRTLSLIQRWVYRHALYTSFSFFQCEEFQILLNFTLRTLGRNPKAVLE